MKELKDIVLKKWDIVYFDNGDIISVIGYEGTTARELNCELKITKIERPVKYETIYEAPNEILDKEEKEYLEAVIRPFKDRIKYIEKLGCAFDYVAETYRYEYIEIDVVDRENFNLPYFETGEYYKGMELNKEYTLKELGLFEE